MVTVDRVDCAALCDPVVCICWSCQPFPYTQDLPLTSMHLWPVHLTQCGRILMSLLFIVCGGTEGAPVAAACGASFRSETVCPFVRVSS